MRDHVILGLHVTDRVQQVPNVQGLLTKYGAQIRTRLGLHDVHGPNSPAGLIVVEIESEIEADKLKRELEAIQGVHVQKMVFKH
ncbi:MAG TPA: hypothetical protein VGP72_29225 [Planctomycetota bacterium]|jgi:hypothetical protein